MKVSAVLRSGVVSLAIVSQLFAGRFFPAGPQEFVVEDEILVKFRPGAAVSAILGERAPNARSEKLSHRELHKLKVNGPSDEAMMRRLADHPHVEFVEPNRVRSLNIAPPNDNLYSSQWALPKMRALEAWTLLPNRYVTAATAGGAERIKVAVLDTGTDCTHPDFMNLGGGSTSSVAGGQLSFAASAAIVASTKTTACAWQDDHGHGTHVAGTIAAATHNGSGVAALGYPLEVMTFKVLAANGVGDDGRIAQAIVAAADAGAKVISMSLSGAGYSQSLQDAAAYARERDVVVIAAAGNANTNTLHFPVGAATVFGVAASTTTGARASFSNFGGYVDIAAPGVGIYSTTPTYTVAGTSSLTYGSMSGTSMATPHVSALAGLVAMATPGIAAGAVATQIQRTAVSTVSGWEQYLGYGNIDAFRALIGEYGAASTGAVTGQVVDAQGLPAGATVTVGGQSVVTGGTGLFRIAGLAPGLHAISATPSAGAPVNGFVAVVAGADANTILRTGVASGAISGVVSNAFGPVAGAVVQAVENGLVKGESLTDPLGQYWLSVRTGTYRLRTSAAAHATTQSAALSVSGTASSNVLLPRLGRVSGTVRDASGAGVSGADVVLEGPTRAGAKTGTNGAYSTIGLPAGSYTVTAYTSDAPPKSVSGVIVANDGTVSADISLDGTAVTITPGSGRLTQLQTLQFSAAVSNTQNQAVTWTRTPAVGSISTAGVYTAPSSISIPQTVTVTATSVQFPTRSASVTIHLANVFTLSLGTSTIAGGTSISAASVKLDQPAPAGGAVVPITSSSPVATVPASVTIAAGATTATFAVKTTAVSTSTAVSFAATYDGITKSVSLTVRAPRVAFLSISPAAVGGGTTTTANKVTLDGPAPTGGVTVALSSSDPTKATVPASVSIAEGASASANFSIVTPTVAQPVTVAITATINDSSKSGNLTIEPVGLSTLSLAKTALVSGVAVTGNVVSSNGPAPAGGLAVTLTSSAPSLVSVPATVVIAAGQTSASFAMSPAAVGTTGTATISAIAGDVIKTINVSVRPAAIIVLAVPSPVISGSTNASNRITLDGIAPPEGTIVTLTSSTAAATVPATVVVPSGASQVNFSTTAAYVTTPTSTTITATAGGVSRAASLTINPLALAALNTLPSLVGGASYAWSTVWINGLAPPEGVAVALTNSNPGIYSTPPSVTILPGSNSAIFVITSAPVTVDTPVTVSATLNGSSKTVVVMITAPRASSVSLSPTSTKGGTVTTAHRAYLTGAAAAPVTVTLTSSNPAVASVPAAVTVPTGGTFAPFSVTTAAVSAPTVVTITSTAGGVSKTANLTVNP